MCVCVYLVFVYFLLSSVQVAKICYNCLSRPYICMYQYSVLGLYKYGLVVFSPVTGGISPGFES